MYKTYSELSKLTTFCERYNYLKLGSQVGAETFGVDRFINQSFYKSNEWLSIRDEIIIRDNGCDLGIESEIIPDGTILLVHHLNPITLKDIEERSELLLNPEYLITTTHSTHNAIHYGTDDYIAMRFTNRTKNDTCPWRNI